MNVCQIHAYMVNAVTESTTIPAIARLDMKELTVKQVQYNHLYCLYMLICKII